MAEDQDISDMERLLLEDPHVISIHRDEELDFPEIDFSLWEERFQEGQRTVMNVFKNHMNGPYIEDDFGSDHTARRIWRGELEEKYDWFDKYYQKNALRLNWANGITTFLTHLEMGYIGNDLAHLKEIRFNLLDMFGGPVDYNSKPSQEKVEYMRLFKSTAYEVLKYFGEHKSPTSSTT